MVSWGDARTWLVRTWHERVRTLSPRTVLAIGFAGFLLYGFPGYMSTDSVSQLVEARTLHFTDGNPPLMAAQWSVLERFVTGPLLMLCLQGVLFLAGTYMLLSRVMTRRAAAWAASAILLFPPVLVPMAVIWKDSQMAAYLIAGCGLMLHPRLRIRFLGLGCLLVACALRHNAFAAVVPLVFFLFEWRSGIRWWKRVVVLGAASIALVAAAFAVTRLLSVDHVVLSPMFQDIVGVMARSEDRSDEEWQRILEGTTLATTTNIQERARKLHAMNGAYHIVQGDDRLFDNPATRAQWDVFVRVWKRLVFEHPGAYLLSHWDTFAVLIGLGPDPYYPAPVWNLFLEDQNAILSIHHSASWSGVQRVLGDLFNWLHEHTSLFAPYIYAFVAILLLVVCARDRVTIGLFISGLLYELSYFPVGVNPDYRYSHWMIASICVGIVILFARRRGQSPT